MSDKPEKFYRTKQASDLTGCTLRQLQYWREKEIIIPTVNQGGRGIAVFYAETELVELVLMNFLLSVHLSFEAAKDVLEIYRACQFKQDFIVFLKQDKPVATTPVANANWQGLLERNDGLIKVPWTQLLKSLEERL